MNILVDYVGHLDLYYSLHLLFEKRLGFKLYCPLYSDDINFGLKIPKFKECYKILNPNDKKIKHYYNNEYGYVYKAINFEKFLEMDFDYIVVTSWENEDALFNLHTQYKPKSIFIRHIANIHEPINKTRNIMLSTKEPHAEANLIKYLPEHRDIFKYNPCVKPEKKICSFFNNFYSYPENCLMLEIIKFYLNDFEFEIYGNGSLNGSVDHLLLPEYMQESMFIWHNKPLGCCGYVARQALACGKPLIVNKFYARIHNTLAIDYLEDGVNCIDLDPGVRSLEDAAKIIKEWSQPDVYHKKCQDVLDSVARHMNFELEAENIKKWLEDLKNENPC